MHKYRKIFLFLCTFWFFTSTIVPSFELYIQSSKSNNIGLAASFDEPIAIDGNTDLIFQATLNGWRRIRCP